MIMSNPTQLTGLVAYFECLELLPPPCSFYWISIVHQQRLHYLYFCYNSRKQLKIMHNVMATLASNICIHVVYVTPTRNFVPQKVHQRACALACHLSTSPITMEGKTLFANCASYLCAQCHLSNNQQNFFFFTKAILFYFLVYRSADFIFCKLK